MTCREAFDIDLAAFLLEPRADEWAAFRSHYPQCATCAAEVRVWTELTMFLEREGDGGSPGQAHPREEALLRFADDRGSMPAADRRLIEQHVTGCLSCQDELGTLGCFDRGGFVDVAARHVGRDAAQEFAMGVRAESSPARAPARWREVLAGARQVIMHPVFAYAVLLIALVPTLVDRMAPVPSGQYAALRDEVAGGPEAEFLPESQGLRFRHAAGERAELVAEGRDDPTSVAVMPSELAATGAREEARPPAARDATRTVGRDNSRQWLDSATRRGKHSRVVVTAAGHGMLVQVPVPNPAREERTLEVRLKTADGARELRERVERPAGADHVEIRVPADWLLPGRYDVELWRGAGATPARSLSIFSVQVPARVP